MKVATLASLVLISLAASGLAAGTREVPPSSSSEIYGRLIPSLASIRVPDHVYVDARPGAIVDWLYHLHRIADIPITTSLFTKYLTGGPQAVSITFENDTFLTALDKFCESMDLRWQITPQGLAVAPPEDFITE